MGIDDTPTGGVEAGFLEEAFSYLLVEGERFGIKAVFVLETCEAGFSREVKEDDEVGAEVLGGEEVQVF